MCDLQSKFEEDRTKTAVAIEDDRYFRQTDRHSSDFISSNAMHGIGQTIKFQWVIFAIFIALQSMYIMY